MLKDFYFENTLWLWGITLLPLIWWLYGWLSRERASSDQMTSFIDPHLIPHLVVSPPSKRNQARWLLFFLSLSWILLICALAGPRWNLEEVKTYTSHKNLTIILDMSMSMMAEDEPPSRIVKAKQEIEDILNNGEATKVALIVFAADAHLISPLTNDMTTINQVLPYLTPDLIHVQGSNLTPALKLAETTFNSKHGDTNSILIISDGGVADYLDAYTKVKDLASKNITLHTMSVGTANGAPAKNKNGTWITKNRTPILFKVNPQELQEISQAGNGLYLPAHYSDKDTQAILDQLTQNQIEKNSESTLLIWKEGFYVLLIPVMIFLLYFFRKGVTVPLILLIAIVPNEYAKAESWHTYFQNNAQQAEAEFKQKKYEDAANKFQDAYQKGVSYFKSQKFTDAEAAFRSVTEPQQVRNARYNLANTLVHLGKYNEAISTYEDILKDDPDDYKTRHNLEIAQQLKEKQQDQPEQDQPEQDQSEQDQSEKDQSEKDQSEKDQSEQDQSEQDQAEQDQSEQDQSEQDQSEQDQSEQDQAEQDQAEQDQSEQDQSEQDQSEQDQSEQDQAEQDQAEQDQAEQDQAEQDQAEQDQAEQDQADQADQAEQDQADQAEQDQAEQDPKSAKDINIDKQLNFMKIDPKIFWKKQFLIESRLKGTKQEKNPW